MCVYVCVYIRMFECVCATQPLCVWWRYPHPGYICCFSPRALYLCCLHQFSLSKLRSLFRHFLVTRTHTHTQQYIEKKEMANMVTDHLAEGLFNNNNHLKCRQCGGSIMDSYAFNVHPDVKFHPNCLKCS